MLGKLLKYEFKATVRMFPFMYGGLLLLALINMIIIPTGSSSIKVPDVIIGIFIGMYVIAAAAVIVATIIAVVIRFYKNQMGDEGYLMFTLPVSVNKLILSKWIVATTWILASVIVSLLSVMLLTAREAAAGNFYGNVGEFLGSARSAGLSPGLWIAGFIVVMVVYAASSSMTYYCAMALGPHITKSRLGGSILAYIIIYVISQAVSAVLVFALLSPFIYTNSVDSASMSFTGNNMFLLNGISTGINAGQINLIGVVTFLFCIFDYLIIAMPCFVVARYFLKRKLNLA